MKRVSKRIKRNRIILVITAVLLLATITTGIVLFAKSRNENKPISNNSTNSEDISDNVSEGENLSDDVSEGENSSDNSSTNSNGNSSNSNSSSGGSSSTVVFPNPLPSGSVECAVVKEGYVELSPYGTSTYDPAGVNYALPRGTQDAIVSKKNVVLIDGTKTQLLTLRSGKVVLARDCTVKKLDFGGNNKINSISSSVSGNDSVVKIGLKWNSPFDIVLNPSATSQSQIGPSYNFTANTVSIIVDYTSEIDMSKISGSFSGNSIFKGSPKVEKIHNSRYNIDQYKITFTLKNPGKYYGCHASFEGNTLVLKFNNPPTTAGTLKGVKIGIDPGHGGADSGAVALDGKTYEKVINLSVATKLKAELEKRGATVYMIRTSDKTIDHMVRKEMAQAQSCDLFISIHQNSTGETGETKSFGSEVHFTTPFSAKLAKTIQAQIGPLNNSTRGTLSHKNFTVCRSKTFPSVLIECGFMRNKSEFQKISNAAYQQKEAVAIANGIVNYYK